MTPDPLLRQAAPPQASPAAAPQAPEVTRPEGGLATAFGALRRSRLLLLFWVVLTFGLPASPIFHPPPPFRAPPLTMPGRRELTLGDVRGPLVGPQASLDSTIVRSQVEILGS